MFYGDLGPRDDVLCGLVEFQPLMSGKYTCHMQRVFHQYGYVHAWQDHFWLQRLNHKTDTFSERGQLKSEANDEFHTENNLTVLG